MSLRPNKLKSQSAKLRRERAEKKKQPKGVSAPNGDMLSTVIPVKLTAARRNRGRMDGVTWNGSSFICSKAIDGSFLCSKAIDASLAMYNIQQEVEEAFSYESECALGLDWVDSPDIRPMTVLLSDIARPAKQRGVAKDFEVVDSLQRVIVEDDFEEDFDYSPSPADEEWELYDEDWEAGLPSSKSYSAVVLGHDR